MKSKRGVVVFLLILGAVGVGIYLSTRKKTTPTSATQYLEPNSFLLKNGSVLPEIEMPATRLNETRAESNLVYKNKASWELIRDPEGRIQKVIVEREVRRQ